MNKYWRKTLLKISVWLFAEVLLSFLGIDDLADYSEFVFDKYQVIGVRNLELTIHHS